MLRWRLHDGRALAGRDVANHSTRIRVNTFLERNKWLADVYVLTRPHEELRNPSGPRRRDLHHRFLGFNRE